MININDTQDWYAKERGVKVDEFDDYDAHVCRVANAYGSVVKNTRAMEFDLEYKLGLFREEQPSLFDENDARYTATPIGKETAEMMLQLINEMERALAKMPDASE